ncbi:ribosome-associated translation inhibitor RaiA [bacterium]|nr:ribosome-associated translation inhibitor RaiA [bacterium]
MNLKITFQNMPHSEPLASHAQQKFAKLAELLSNVENRNPMHAELWLKAHKQHNHHGVELHIKTPHFDLNAHEEGPDMYIAVDNTMDKMLRQIKKEKERLLERHHKPDTDKRRFER